MTRRGIRPAHRLPERGVPAATTASTREAIVVFSATPSTRKPASRAASAVVSPRQISLVRNSDSRPMAASRDCIADGLHTVTTLTAPRCTRAAASTSVDGSTATVRYAIGAWTRAPSATRPSVSSSRLSAARGTRIRWPGRTSGRKASSAADALNLSSVSVGVSPSACALAAPHTTRACSSSSNSSRPAFWLGRTTQAYAPSARSRRTAAAQRGPRRARFRSPRPRAPRTQPLPADD